MSNRRLRSLRRWVCISMLSGGILPVALCVGNENFREFRVEALPGVQSGVKTLVSGGEGSFENGLSSILNSLIDGVFEVIEPDGVNGRP